MVAIPRRFSTINGKILLTFLGSISLGILLIVSFATSSAIGFSNFASDRTAEFTLDQELITIDDIVQDNSILVSEYFREYISKVNYLSEYAQDLFNNRIVMQPRDSYYGNLDDTANKQRPPDYAYSAKHGVDVSYDYSGWYWADVNNVETQITGSDLDLVKKSSNLDFVFHSLFNHGTSDSINQDQSPFLWSYMGFSTGLHRTYPYKDLSSWDTKEFSICNTNDVRVGYDPRIRQYYCDAANTGDIVIPRPQQDPTLGILKISISKPVYYDNGDLVGVVGADLTIDEVEATVSDLKVLENGYAYMIDREGNAVMHPNIDRSLSSQKLTSLEFSDVDEISKFSSIQDDLTNLKEGSGSFVKDNEKWYISYSPIANTGFNLAVVVPESDILAGSEEIQRQIVDSLISQILVYLAIILTISGGMILFTRYISVKIVAPIEELTEVSEQIAKGNLHRDLNYTQGGSREIITLFNTFRGLLTALRFGNEAYYAGRLSRAESNYRDALDLFTTLENRKGTGICYNNLGNVERSKGDLKEANKSYRLAIDIANDLLDHAEDDLDKLEHQLALASRYSNLGLLYKEIEQFDRAEEFLTKAMNYDRETDNARGLVTRMGNLGQVFLLQGKVKEAKEQFDEAFLVANDLDSERAKAYANMNYGLFEKDQKNYDKATEYFLKAVEYARDIDTRVVRSSFINLQEIYEATGQKVLAQEVLAKVEEFTSKMRNKEITYVLDYSGSMAGKRIRAALKGMKSIFKNQVNDDDIVSLILFSTRSETVIRPKPKGGNESKFMLKFDRLTKPGGGTAFYDAVYDAFVDFANRPTDLEQWIIALTDGDDNMSTKNFKSVLKMARQSVGVNLVIIGVGSLEDRDQLKELCEITDKGQFIDVKDGVAEAISTAFEEVGNMLSEVEVEGFIPDY